jgi:two-component system sensor histidine kinase MprB
VTSLRLRLAIGLALLAALSVVAVATSNYLQTSDRLHAQVDATLRSDTRPLAGGEGSSTAFVAAVFCQQIRDGEGAVAGYTAKITSQLGTSVQCLNADGAVSASIGRADLPAPEDAAGSVGSTVVLTTQEVDGHTYRVASFAGPEGGTIRIIRSLATTERVLESIRERALIIGGVVILLAAALGWLIAGLIIRPVERLTTVAERVAATGELAAPVSTKRRDEVGRLARAFSSMLTALNESRSQQQRLVEDASHELRTPLTSLRTNIDTLRRHEDLDLEVRTRILEGLDTELRALGALTDELVELTVGARTEEPAEALDLELLVQRAANLVEQRSGRTIDVEATPSTVVARPSALLRAVVNILDNAVKFSPPSTPIEVVTGDGRVEVRDHGPGIDADDLPFVFDRFYRAVGARSLPGSGLGLSIVRTVAEESGGSVLAGNHDAGAFIALQLPTAAATSDATGAVVPRPR